VDEINKAVRILKSGGDLDIISENLGNEHKVRNFYNNIIDPNNDIDVTIDTHAVAAAWLLPLGGTATEVSHNLGSASSSGPFGVSGNYWLYADAYRELASDLDILPRELQSITWEAIRGLFTPEQKRDKALIQEMQGLWENSNNATGTRQQIIDRGIELPFWAQPDR